MVFSWLQKLQPLHCDTCLVNEDNSLVGIAGLSSGNDAVNLT